MTPTTLVEKDESGIQKVLKALDKLEESRFIQGILCRQHTIDDIESMKDYLQMHLSRVRMESKSLSRFSETFIGDYATNNNACFTTAERLFNRMSSTIGDLKKLFKDTTSISRRRLPEGVSNPSVFDVSPLGSRDVQLHLFGLEEYHPAVGELYQTIEMLFKIATSTLVMCRKMIEDERLTRDDKVRLKQIYEKSCSNLEEGVRFISKFVAPTQEIPANEMEERRMKAKSEDEFIQNEYHRHNKSELSEYVAIRVLKKARDGGLSQLEQYFWPNDREKALRVRKVIECFDMVSDVEGEKGRLDSSALVEFLKWCGVKEHLEKQLYEKHFCPKYIAQGKLSPLGWNAVSGRRKYLKDGGWTDENLARCFEKRLDSIFSAIDDSQLLSDTIQFEYVQLV